MEKHEEAILNAKKKYQLADHMLNVTYPLVRDTKLLLPIIENIFLAMGNAMASVLYHDLKYKRIPQFSSTFDSKFNVFKEHCVHMHSIDRSYVSDMHEIKTIIVERKASPVEFVRKDRLVICNKDYKMRTLSIADLRSYLSKAKLFIEGMNNIINQK